MAVACDSASLVANATCYQCQMPEGTKLPACIALAVQLAGVNPDPAYLMAQAACLECQIPPGLELPTLIAAACAFLNGPLPPTPCVNILPAGASYSQTASFLFSHLVVGNSYIITLGSNELDVIMDPLGTQIVPPIGTPFVATSPLLEFGGTQPLIQVTATLCAI